MTARLAICAAASTPASITSNNGSAARRLAKCHGSMDWPKRGVYFFMRGRRGTLRFRLRLAHRARRHARAESSIAHARLWKRLSQHKGQAKSGGGNHRGSIFRLLVGSTLRELRGICLAPRGASATPQSREVRLAEEAPGTRSQPIIGAMPSCGSPSMMTPDRNSLRG